MGKLDKSVQYLKGVGPKKARALRNLNIETISDLLHYFPRTYEDRRQYTSIADTKDGQKTSLIVVVSGPALKYRPRRGLEIIKIPVRDDTGAAYLVWFNQKYIANSFKIGEVVKVNGKVKKSYNEVQISSPVFEKDGDAKEKVGLIAPIYSLTDKLKNNEITKLISNAIKEHIEFIEEVLPIEMLSRLKLCSIHQAIINIHFPQDRQGYVKARERLVFEELLILQIGLFVIRNKYKREVLGISFNKVDEIQEFIYNLPFELTDAQRKVLAEISYDMESTKPMNRLVQGDVGSGKTIIAVLAIFKAIKSGYQTVMMAPTEILAQQHFESIEKLLLKYDINCKLLTGSVTKKERQDILENTKNGEIDLLIGTHALIQEEVEFKRLGLAVTDEQHRFGVRQRALLFSKGDNPDFLVMSATPIPRTLALILYGDLDISIIDELPPGRKKIKTYSINSSMRLRAYDFVKKQINERRQAYVVCPLVEESDTLDIKSASELYDEFSNDIFKEYNIGLIHGKMSSREKDETMHKFKMGLLDILISTTVIEVGVNVPNANIMIIQNAERFGLAQLHQLRGRVGRGEYQSYCILINDNRNRIALERMSIMEKTNDGFLISEKDLELRGPGEFLGTRQHGVPDLKIANLFTDVKLLKLAQKVSEEILNNDPLLKSEKYKRLREKIIEKFKEKSADISFN